MTVMGLTMMNRLTNEAVAEIKACQGVYRASDTARTYEVARSTVTRIWAGTRQAQINAAPEVPNVVSRNRPSELQDDIRLLLDRGLSTEEVASELGVSERSVYAYRGVFV